MFKKRTSETLRIDILEAQLAELTSKVYDDKLKYIQLLDKLNRVSDYYKSEDFIRSTVNRIKSMQL